MAQRTTSTSRILAAILRDLRSTDYVTPRNRAAVRRWAKRSTARAERAASRLALRAVDVR